MNKTGHGYLPSLTFLLSLMMISIVGLSISRGLWRSTGQLRESWLVAEYCAVQGIVACGLAAGCVFFAFPMAVGCENLKLSSLLGF